MPNFYGGPTPSYGMSKKSPEEDALQQALGDTAQVAQKAKNRQRQTPYAAQNGMAQAANATPPSSRGPAQYGGPTDKSEFSPGASPVSADGQIRATTQEQYRAPAPAPAPAVAPAAAPPPAPALTPAIAPVPAPPVAPAPAPWAQAAPAPAPAPLPPAAAPPPGQGPVSPIPSYQAAQFSNQSLPNMGDFNSMQMTALQQALAGNPLESEKMKARLREDATAMGQQQQQQVDQNVAGRGTFGGGWQGAEKANIGQDTTSNILSGYRDVDIAAADRKQSDLLAALGASENIAGGQFGRGLGAAQFGREGELAQAGENMGAARYGMDKSGQETDAYFRNLLANQQASLTREGYSSNMQQAKLQALVNMLGQSQNAWANQGQLGLGYTSLQQNALNQALG